MAYYQNFKMSKLLRTPNIHMHNWFLSRHDIDGLISFLIMEIKKWLNSDWVTDEDLKFEFLCLQFSDIQPKGIHYKNHS